MFHLLHVIGNVLYIKMRQSALYNSFRVFPFIEMSEIFCYNSEEHEYLSL